MFGGVGRSIRALGAAVLIAAAGALWAVATPTPAVGAQTGLSYVSTAVWTVDPAVARVHVALEVTATSHAQDSNGRRYFFTGLVMSLPPSTAAFAATDDQGKPMPVTILTTVPSGVVVNVALRQKLYSGQSVTFGLTFDVVDSGGSTDRDLRIGQDALSFPISAFGSQGTPGSSVTVIFPPGFVVQEPIGILTSSVDSTGRTIFRSGTIADSTALSAWFTASQSAPTTNFLISHVEMGPIAVTLRYWADDPGWALQVGGILASGYPILRGLIGLGDPAVRTLTVEEATTRGIGGFSGEYDPVSSTVKVSYFADPVVILHEAAHMWFNGDLASDRWINEGFASFYAEQAVDTLGLPDRSPAISPALLSAATPLNYWTEAGTPGTATEAYLYGASLQAAREMANTAGIGGLRDIWAMAVAHTPAYGRSAGNGPGDPANAPGFTVSGPTDWTRLLDYLEQTTGRSFTAIWRHWVVTPLQTSLLDARDAARAQYQDAESLAGWDLPPDIRQAMSGWDFGAARGLLDKVPAIVSYREQIGAQARSEGTAAPAALATAFETVGTNAALDEARSELDALASLASARQAQIDFHGAAGAVGLLGEDPSTELVAARKAFSDGDSAQAGRLAELARTAWAGATGVGQIRIIGTASGIAGVLLLLALYIWTRSRRRLDGRGGLTSPASTEQRPNA
jgi:hypothetical protein